MRQVELEALGAIAGPRERLVCTQAPAACVVTMRSQRDSRFVRDLELLAPILWASRCLHLQLSRSHETTCLHQQEATWTPQHHL